MPFVPTSLEAERNSSEGEAPASRQRHIQAGTARNLHLVFAANQAGGRFVDRHDFSTG
jgi:hypothetical protein